MWTLEHFLLCRKAGLQPEDHQIVNQNSEQALARLRLMSTCPERLAQESFVARKGALNLPALSVESTRETSPELRTVFSRRSFAEPVARIQFDDAGTNPQHVTA